MYDGPIIDCDIHNNPVSQLEYFEYLPQRWRDFLTLRDGSPNLSMLGPAYLNAAACPDGLNKRLDAYSDNGGPTGSDYGLMCEQLLDAYDIEAGILDHDVGQQAALTNGDLALAICQASNDWMADKWLSGMGDDRLYAVVLVPTQTPADGAREIRRCAENPRFVSAMVAWNGLGKPLGHPAYHEMYEAMAETGLPMHIHVNGGEYFGSTASLSAGGGPFSYKFEQYQHVYQSTVNHVTSLIVHGVFEKYPTLKLLLTESSLSWIPWFAQRLDANYDLLRHESPWVKKRPSEYIREHIFFSTQPCEALQEEKSQFVEELSLFEGIEDTIVFTSDYPHWDADDPRYVFSIFPKEWHEKIASENARRVLRLPATFRHGSREAVAA
jgi:hypothetical protein